MEVLRQEFRLRNFTWCHTQKADFVLSQWRLTDQTDICYLVYRLFHSLMFLLVFAVYAVVAFQSVTTTLRGLAFFTMWSYIICIMYSIYATIYIRCTVKHKEFLMVRDISLPSKILWILHSVAVDVTFSVSILFWFGKLPCKKVLPLYTDLIHIWNTVLMLMDFFVVAIPIRILHVYASIIVASIYAVFTYVYYYLGGVGSHKQHALYPLLDWKNDVTKALLVVIGSLVFLVVFRFVIYGMYRLRCLLFIKLLVAWILF